MHIGVLFLFLLVLVLLEVPVAFAMIIRFLSVPDAGRTGAPSTSWSSGSRRGWTAFPLLAIPLFVLAGNILNAAGIAQRIFDFAMALFGHVRGSLAHVNVVASIIFAGMSGVAQADAAGLGTNRDRGHGAGGVSRGISARR